MFKKSLTANNSESACRIFKIVKDRYRINVSDYINLYYNNSFVALSISDDAVNIASSHSSMNHLATEG